MKYRNKWLSSMAEDINKIVDSESTTSDDRLVKGLLGTLTEYWYFIENIPSNSAFIKFDGGVGLDPSKFNSKSDGKGVNYFYSQLREAVSNFYATYKMQFHDVGEDLLNLIQSMNSFVIGNYGESLNTVEGDINNNNAFIWGYNSQSVTATGGDANDVIVGTTDVVSALSGGKGNDTLIGLAGSLINLGEKGDILDKGEGEDYIYSFGNYAKLDRGAGNYNDVLEFYGEHSTLIGGEGDDTLKSYYANKSIVNADTLEGGKGIDKYYVDKADTIKDEEGLGSVELDEKTLIGGIRDEKDTTKFKSADGKYVYTFDEKEPRTIIINGGLRIENFLPEGKTVADIGLPYTYLGITLKDDKEDKKEMKPMKMEIQISLNQKILDLPLFWTSITMA